MYFDVHVSIFHTDFRLFVFFLDLSREKKQIYIFIYLCMWKLCCGSKWVMLCLVSPKEVERLFLKFMSLKNMRNTFWKLYEYHTDTHPIYARSLIRPIVHSLSASLALSLSQPQPSFYTTFHIPINRKTISIGCSISTNNRIPD